MAKKATTTKSTKQADSKSAQTTALPLRNPMFVVAMAFVYLVVGLIVALSIPESREFLEEHRWWFSIGIGGLIFGMVVGLVFRPIRDGIARAAPSTRVGIIVATVVPLFLLVVIALVFLPEEHHPFALGLVFWIVASLLPASMYYLFLGTRKRSLLNEYFANLRRMGLLSMSSQATGETFSVQGSSIQLLSYLEKFEGVYGPVRNRKQCLRRLRAYIDSGEGESGAFDADADDEWGLTSLLSPIVLLPLSIVTILVSLGWLLVLNLQYIAPALLPGDQQPTQGQPDYWYSGSLLQGPEAYPTLYAFLGAYFFAILMIFRRYVRRDLGPSAYVAVANRIVLGIVGAWVVAFSLTWIGNLSDVADSKLDAATAIAAFVVGAFPRIAWQYVSAAARKFSGARLIIPSLKQRLPLSDLDGLTVWHEARLEEEDIENIPNMATADPVELILQTRFPPGRLVDWIDQSILYTCLGTEAIVDGKVIRNRIREYGIRTASALLVALDQRCPHGETDEADEKCFGIDREQIETIRVSLVIYPNLHLVLAWRGIDLGILTNGFECDGE